MKTNFLIRILTLGILLTGSLTALAQPAPRYKMGMKINDQAYLKLPRKSRSVMLKGILPEAYSLRQFAPEVATQGDFGTCVAWATTTARTMAEARKRKLGGQIDAINALRLSPTYIYEQIKQRDDDSCQNGSQIPDALHVMKTRGNMLMARVPYACGTTVSSEFDKEAGSYRIENYATLIDVLQTSADVKILAIKSALTETENPVVFGMLVPRSFFSAKDTWRAAPGESPTNAVGGHAMTIVGYDNTKNGGSFLIMNSWGKGWGNKGYTWANAADLIRFTKYAFQMYLAKPGAPTPQPDQPPIPATVTLAASMTFAQRNGAEMPVFSVEEKGLDTKDDAKTEMITYRTKESYPSGTGFHLTFGNNRQSYVYVISSDDVNRSTKLFPYSANPEEVISPIMPANTQVVLPGIGKSFVMDNQPGNDYFLVLVSEKELNPDDLLDQIKAGTGTFQQRVYAAIGKDLIAPADITYKSDAVDFQVKGTPKGTIVPLLIKIGHK